MMMNRFAKMLLNSVVLILLIFTGCKSKTQYNDTPTTGSIFISVDETFKPIAQSEIDVFEAIYNTATIKAAYNSEIDAFNKLLKDSVRLIISSRKLTVQEKDFFKSKKFFPKEIKIAVDAVALIVHPNNKDTLISVEVLKDILCGKITDWKQINSKSKLGKIKLIFDNPNSSTLHFMLDSVCKGVKLSDNLSALETNANVVDFVSKTFNAIGVIGTSFVTDRNDTTSLSFLQKIKVMAVSKEPIATYENSFQPYQAYIATHQYPLTRDIYIINAEPRTGLASGFTSFVASERGQRIILKSGILPATQPIRLIKVNNDFLN
ncbi:MAG: substrate-binding domain-containing protein [Bacteroidota bacterium]